VGSLGTGREAAVRRTISIKMRSLALSITCHRKRFHRLQRRLNLASIGNRLGRVAAVFVGVLVTPWSARRFSAVHPAAAVRHRGRPALVPAPCPRPTTEAEGCHATVVPPRAPAHAVHRDASLSVQCTSRIRAIHRRRRNPSRARAIRSFGLRLQSARAFCEELIIRFRKSPMSQRFFGSNRNQISFCSFYVRGPKDRWNLPLQYRIHGRDGASLRRTPERLPDIHPRRTRDVFDVRRESRLFRATCSRCRPGSSVQCARCIQWHI
jgi:hypothetical protein